MGVVVGSPMTVAVNYTAVVADYDGNSSESDDGLGSGQQSRQHSSRVFVEGESTREGVSGGGGGGVRPGGGGDERLGSLHDPSVSEQGLPVHVKLSCGTRLFGRTDTILEALTYLKTWTNNTTNNSSNRNSNRNSNTNSNREVQAHAALSTKSNYDTDSRSNDGSSATNTTTTTSTTTNNTNNNSNTTSTRDGQIHAALSRKSNDDNDSRSNDDTSTTNTNTTTTNNSNKGNTAPSSASASAASAAAYMPTHASAPGPGLAPGLTPRPGLASSPAAPAVVQGLGMKLLVLSGPYGLGKSLVSKGE